MISNPVPWPDGARCAVAVSWDLDGDSGLHYYRPDRADTLLAAQSQTRYGPLIAVPQILKVMRGLEVPNTFFVPGWCIERYPHAVDAIAEAGQEIGLHGYVHERPNELEPERERDCLARAVAAHQRHFGIKARGWRAPSFAFSKHSLSFLAEAGFAYDSSLMGDEVPYRITDGRSAMIELPVKYELDDGVHFMHVPAIGLAGPISSPEQALAVYRAEFDAVWEYSGLWISVWHPFVSGRPSRLRMIVELIEYMQTRGGVWFASLGEVAGHVEALIAQGTWTPREDSVALYDGPISEIAWKT